MKLIRQAVVRLSSTGSTKKYLLLKHMRLVMSSGKAALKLVVAKWPVESAARLGSEILNYRRPARDSSRGSQKWPKLCIIALFSTARNANRYQYRARAKVKGLVIIE